jgi:serine/threonine protein kinase
VAPSPATPPTPATETQVPAPIGDSVPPPRTNGRLARLAFERLGIGSVVGKYEIVERIGHGSTSTVFLGRHLKLRFPVAVKVLDRTRLNADPQLLEVLVGEAVHLAQINHPNVVRLWDLDDEATCPYLVLEYVPGGTLADLIRQKGRIPFAFAWAIARQAVEGLAEAHKSGVVHRDVKPGNLLLATDGHVKVADLGLAMIVSDRAMDGSPTGSRSGDSGIRKGGTVAYLAPEQAGDPSGIDFRADIYGLGATLYHALTGRMVFEGSTAIELIMKHSLDQPTPPAHFVPDLPAPCSAVLMKMLAKRPEERFASYDELRMALAQAVGDRRAPRPLADAFLEFADRKRPVR